MPENQTARFFAENEYRYRSLRSAVADYHYHVLVEGGRILKKLHGANCEVATGYASEEYVAEGLTTSIIANQLFLSTHTIDTHRENIKRKLKIKTAAELSRAAVQWFLENG